MLGKRIISTPLHSFSKSAKTVKLGRLNWQADSYHIYGKDIHAAKELLFDRISEMDFENRTMNFNDPFINEMYDGAETVVINKIKTYDEFH